LRRQSQRNLIEFLNTELELAQTFLSFVKDHRDRRDTTGYARSLNNAKIALETV